MALTGHADDTQLMSAFGGKADMMKTRRNVRFGLKADTLPQTNSINGLRHQPDLNRTIETKQHSARLSNPAACVANSKAIA